MTSFLFELPITKLRANPNLSSRIIRFNFRDIMSSFLKKNTKWREGSTGTHNKRLAVVMDRWQLENVIKLRSMIILCKVEALCLNLKKWLDKNIWSDFVVEMRYILQ